MKAKKIVAAVACTALAAVAAVPLSACGGLGSTKLDAADYAVEYSVTAQAAYTDLARAVTLASNETYYTSYGDIALIRNDYDYTYKAVNLQTGSTLVSDISDYNSGSTYVNGRSLYYVRLHLNNGAYNIYANDGVLLIDGIDNGYPNFSYNSNVLTVSGTSAATNGTVTKYFKVDASSSVLTLTPTTSSAASGGLSVGDTYNGLKESIYSEDVKGDISDYSYANIGYTYYFYDGKGDLKSTLDIGNGQFLGFVDNYMYYNTLEPVDSEKTKGYNYMYNNSYISQKYNVTLHKYDVLKGKDSKVKADFVLDGIRPLYNKNSEAYDAAIIYGSKMTDGVACYDFNEFAYVVDKDLKVAYDISWYYQSNSLSSVTLYSVGNGYYKLGNYIVDESLTPVNSSSSSNDSYFNEGLIPFTESGATGFTDIEGKVVIEAEYNNVGTFFGGVAYATTKTGQRVLLNKNGKTSDVPEGASVSDGYYYTSDNGTRRYYNFSGKLLREIDSIYSVTERTNGSHVYLIVVSNNETNIYKFV